MRLIFLFLVLGLGACSDDSPPASEPPVDVGTDMPDAAEQDMSEDVSDMSEQTPVLNGLLEALRNNVTEAMFAQSHSDGWPALVEGGLLFVSTNPALNKVAGDHDEWVGTAMTVEDGFAWKVLAVNSGRYKFTNGQDWSADPWSRAYAWDENGEISLIKPSEAHRERFFDVQSHGLLPRMVRVWVPAEEPTHVLYMHDGQNLMDPDAIWGGWKIQESAPAAMLIVGMDNTSDRFGDYTHVTDLYNGNEVGGKGDAYADFVHMTVRELVRNHYGEPAKVGTMGSSLGGLISFHIADRYPQEFDFAASLSGTMGWGSMNLRNETMIERYQAAGLRNTKLYLDSGGGADSCLDTDVDGIEDDGQNDSDNFCENKQLERILMENGYIPGETMWHWHELNAPHNEAAWAARVFRPLGIFADL